MANETEPASLAELDLTKPMSIRAEMARSGLHDLYPYDSPDTGWTNPLNDHEQQQLVRSFLARLWRACIEAEKKELPQPTVPTMDLLVDERKAM